MIKKAFNFKTFLLFFCMVSQAFCWPVLEFEPVSKKKTSPSKLTSSQGIVPPVSSGTFLSTKGYTDPVTGMAFVWVPGGCFKMGDTFGSGESGGKPVREVCVDGFWMGKYEVTQEEWEKVMGSNQSLFKGRRRPAERVSWSDCQAFIKKLNSQSGKKYRLPYEAEWEYAARSGGKKEKYSGSNDLDRVAWYYSNSGVRTHDVGIKEPNGLGLYDMSGNVWEWCENWYGPFYYKNSPRKNPSGPSTGSRRVIRGGSWYDISLSLRAAHSSRSKPELRNEGIGFRLVLPGKPGRDRLHKKELRPVVKKKTSQRIPKVSQRVGSPVSSGSNLSKDTYTDPVTGMVFVRVPGGCYKMGDVFGDGDPDEKPLHEVCVDGFWMGKFEVTQEEWTKVMGSNQSRFNGRRLPVERVSWYDCQKFIYKLNGQSGKKYRLAYEAEWEYAARSGGKKEKFSGGNDAYRVAWSKSNSGGHTHEVGSKRANSLGLHDMSGNVWEWCEDWYGVDYYHNSSRNNPQGPSSGSSRVFRGGSWIYYQKYVRAANRSGDEPGLRGSYLGFRLVLPIE